MKKTNKTFLVILSTAIIIISFFYSLFFYSSQEGLKSVYIASYDWKIDFLAILSGAYIISIAVYIYYKKKIKLIPFLILFIIGSAQAMMHFAKWIIRIKMT